MIKISTLRSQYQVGERVSVVRNVTDTDAFPKKIDKGVIIHLYENYALCKMKHYLEGFRYTDIRKERE